MSKRYLLTTQKPCTSSPMDNKYSLNLSTNWVPIILSRVISMSWETFPKSCIQNTNNELTKRWIRARNNLKNWSLYRPYREPSRRRHGSEFGVGSDWEWREVFWRYFPQRWWVWLCPELGASALVRRRRRTFSGLLNGNTNSDQIQTKT